MTPAGYVELAYDVTATAIPSGNPMTLRAGTPVRITQSLGGTWTVQVTGVGGLYRIQGIDAAALGEEAPPQAMLVAGPFDEEKVWEQLRNCYDPEIPVNIVDLGLIYGMEATDEEAGKHVAVRMTLTAPGCGMGPSLASDAELRLLTVPGVSSAKVSLVWDPPWTPELISAAGKEKLGME